jgi:hypothetical protein
MSTRAFLLVPAAALLSLCSVSCVPPADTSYSAPPTISDADRQLALATTFVQGGDFKRALHIYTMVADDNPVSPSGATATQMAALVMTTLRNPARSDSMGTVWFRKALARTRSTDQRLQTEVPLALLDRLSLQTTEMRRHRTIVDSLQRVIRRQSGTILSQTRRLQDMEREVVAAKGQVQRLKELDENLSRTRGTR